MKYLSEFRDPILADVLIFSPSFYEDNRGMIWTNFSEKVSDAIDFETNFTHDKVAISRKGVLRGIHFDNKTSKLVSCLYGEIQQVVVDLRPESPNYLKWSSYNLIGYKPKLILVPPYFGNAFPS